MKNNFKEEKFGIFIISVDNKVRNPDLPKQAVKFWSEAKVELITAVTPKDISQDLLCYLSEESSALLGRRISDFEIAVAQSHRKCYEMANDMGYSKLLILEDDVHISNEFIISKTDLERLDESNNIIISLYAPIWSLWVNRKGKTAALYPPAYAAAYLINRNGINFALSHESLGLADWPTWSSKFKFYLTSGEQFDTVVTNSYLEADRQKSKIEKSRKDLLARKKYKSQNIKEVDIFKYKFLYPLLWKLLGNKSGKSRILKFYL
jgi:hypothetical protein